MRILIVVIGVVLMVVGAIFLVIPVVSQSPAHLQAAGNKLAFQSFQVSGFSVLYQQPVSGSWSSNTSVLFELIVCTAACNTNTSISQTLVQTGTSGNFTVDVPQGDIVSVAIEGASGGPATATVNVSTALTPLGSGLLIAGIAIILIGFVLRRKRRVVPRPAPRVQPAPATITVDAKPAPKT
ncbi:MAG: hypothetical protein L3K17_02800 [Thermoplasmata archaeon]|nr:hypothetical protein [Thermoplasmata archaeon]